MGLETWLPIINLAMGALGWLLSRQIAQYESAIKDLQAQLRELQASDKKQGEHLTRIETALTLRKIYVPKEDNGPTSPPLGIAR